MLPSIPGDVLIMVMEYLSFSDLARLSLTSRDMYHLVSMRIVRVNYPLMYYRSKSLGGTFF